MSDAYKIIISPHAKRDITAIRIYTLQNWGPAKADGYVGKIEDVFLTILENPMLGRERDDIKKGYRSIVIEKHVLFYKLNKSDIYILGLPHGRMDILNYFS